MENAEQYQEWSEEELNQRIFALYDHIERVTLENLDVAQKNCQLEVQIKTIDGILQSCPGRHSEQTISTNQKQQSIQRKYDNLVEDHIKLTERVNQMEELLYDSNRNRGGGERGGGGGGGGGIVRSMKGSMVKTSSVQNLLPHRRTGSKVQSRPPECTSRYEALPRRKSKFK